MKKVFKGFMVAAAVTLSAGVALNAAADTAKLDQLLEQVKKDRISEAKIDQAREQEFLSDRADKQALLNKAKAEFNAEDARGKALTKKYAENEGALATKAAELQTALGTLGEVVGMVRQNAAETIGSISSSVISAQYPGRAELLSKLASAKEVPNIKELEDLWIALQTEMTESAKNAKFETQVVNLDGSTETKQVTRIGSLNLMSDSQYLLYNADTQQVQPLGRDPESYIVATVADYAKASAGEMVGIYIDPTAGNLLRLNTQKATLMDKFHQGGEVGYAISILAVIGVLFGLFRLMILAGVSAKVNAQMKNLSNPSSNNPLGRVLKVYHDNKDVDVENLELKLDEAILRETPKIDGGVNMIKLFAAVAPLMGLLGTVIGMIGTFQSITLYGSGDPKIMAADISMALVTTAQGLIAALPLLFTHAILSGRVKSILHILDEQSAGIIAEHAEKEKA